MKNNLRKKSYEMFGKYIKKLRISNKLTIKELAISSNLSVGFINQLENGKNFSPKLESILKLASVLNIEQKEINELLFNKQHKILSLDIIITKNLSDFGFEAEYIQEIIAYINTVKLKQKIKNFNIKIL